MRCITIWLSCAAVLVACGKSSGGGGHDGTWAHVTLAGTTSTGAEDAARIVKRLRASGLEARDVRAGGKRIELTVSDRERFEHLAPHILRPQALQLRPVHLDQAPVTFEDAPASEVASRERSLGYDHPPLPIFHDRAALEARIAALPPELRAQVAVETRTWGRTDPPSTGYGVLRLEANAPVTNEDIADARVSYDGNNAVVVIDMTPEGAREFEAMTAQLVERHLAIVVDGHVMMAPIIEEPITGGRARITMGRQASPTDEALQAMALAASISTSPLAGPWRIEKIEPAT